MNSFAYDHQYWWKTLKTEIMGRNLHRNPIEKVYKSTESLKNVIYILGNANQAAIDQRLLLDYRIMN